MSAYKRKSPFAHTENPNTLARAQQIHELRSQKLTLKEIAQIQGLSIQRVSQILIEYSAYITNKNATL